MKTIKAISVLLLSVILQLVLLPFNIVVAILEAVEALIRIIRTTITFLIKQIEYEVLKTPTYGKKNAKQGEEASEDAR